MGFTKTNGFTFKSEYLIGWFIMFSTGFAHNVYNFLQVVLLRMDFNIYEIIFISNVGALILLVTLVLCTQPSFFCDNTYGWKMSLVWIHAICCTVYFYFYPLAADMIGFGDSMAIGVCSGTFEKIYLMPILILI